MISEGSSAAYEHPYPSRRDLWHAPLARFSNLAVVPHLIGKADMNVVQTSFMIAPGAAFSRRALPDPKKAVGSPGAATTLDPPGVEKPSVHAAPARAADERAQVRAASAQAAISRKGVR